MNGLSSQDQTGKISKKDKPFGMFFLHHG